MAAPKLSPRRSSSDIEGGGRSAAQRFVTVGRYGTLTSEQARKQAKAILEGVAKVGEALAAVAILGEVHHREPSRDQMLRVAQVTAHTSTKAGSRLAARRRRDGLPVRSQRR